ncbi:Uncharacterised protein [uncultured archaeon]|nr:Uncharacterised protein [uncultured archaeon]
MDNVIEESIIKLFEDFKQNPEYFKHEDNLRYRFCDIIIGQSNEYKFRWEYPTKLTYSNKKPDVNSKYPNKIDICFIKDESLDSVPYAFEFKLLLNKINEKVSDKSKFSPGNFNLIDPDFEELCESGNNINTGYIIFFTFGKIISNQKRKDRHIKNKSKFFAKYDKLYSKIPSHPIIKVVFVCVDNLDNQWTYSIKHNLNNSFPETLKLNEKYVPSSAVTS